GRSTSGVRARIRNRLLFGLRGSLGRRGLSGLGLGLSGLLGLLLSLLNRLLLGLGGLGETGGDLGLVLVGLLLADARGGDLQRSRGLKALELLPVAGQLEQCHDGLARLGADAEPVLRALGIHLDERGLFLRVV